MKVDLRQVPSTGLERNDVLLFSESPSRFVVTVHPEDFPNFERCLQGNIFSPIGWVNDSKEFIAIGKQGRVVVQEEISELKEVWKRPLRF